MIRLKKVLFYLKQIGFYLAFILILAIFLSVLNLIGLKSNVTNVLAILILIIYFLVMGIIHGKKAESKGFLVGLKLGLSMILILIIIDLLFFRAKFSMIRIIYYLILLLSCILGGTIGINHKKNK